MWGKMKPKERKYLVFQERGCPLFNISVGSICTHTHLRTPLGTSLPPLCLLGFFFSLCSTFKQQENRKKREREGEKKNADWRVGFRWLAWLVWCCCCHCHATAALLTFMSNHVQCIFSFFSFLDHSLCWIKMTWRLWSGCEPWAFFPLLQTC